MLLMLIGMGGGSLSKELYDWFGYTPSTATASAFVQQRNKIRSKAIEMIFNEFVASAMPTMTFRGYRLFAVDGSDLRLPSDPTNDFSLIRNMDGQKQYNLAHLNAMFDLMSKAYVDVTMQGKKGMNEHKALVSMIDRSNIPGKVSFLSYRYRKYRIWFSNISIFDPLLNILHRRQLALQFFRQVAGDLIGADADGLAHVLERILCHEVILALAEQQTNRWIVLFLL